MAFYDGGGGGGYSSGGYGGGGGGNTYSNFNNNNNNSSDNFFMGQQQQQQQPNTFQPQQPQQQQQQQQNSNPNAMNGGMNNFFNPAMAMAAANAVAGGKMGDNTVMMNMAESMGKQFLETGWAKAVPGLERTMLGLRPYFAVDNVYVKRKMMKVLFPFVFREWARQEAGATADGKVSYALPQHDDNAPDLYIPVMSLLTYVLLCALCYGTAGKFDPEVLPDVTTKCLGFQLLEVIAIRIGFYLMEAPVPILDLFCYTGYKYLGLVINMFSGITVGHLLGYGHKAYYFTYLWTASAVSYFILKVMANSIPRITSAVGPKRQFMVLGFAASQFATCWFVSQTKFLE